MTTPILGLTEMATAQTEPHIVVNTAIRALEVHGQTVAIAMDVSEPPASYAEGDVYIVGENATDDFEGHSNEIAYMSGGWKFLVPKEGWKAFVLSEDSTFRYTTGSPAWVLDTGGIDAADIPYAQASSPNYSPAPETVGEALDAILAGGIGGGGGGPVDAGDVSYAQASSPAFESPAPTDVGGALDSIFQVLDSLLDAEKRIGIPISIPGKPGAGAIYHIPIPFDITIHATLPGSVGYAGTNATSSAAFALYKNGVQFGTVTFPAGTSAPIFAAANHAHFAPGDHATLVAPGSQDATLSDVGITLVGERTL